MNGSTLHESVPLTVNTAVYVLGPTFRDRCSIPVSDSVADRAWVSDAWQWLSADSSAGRWAWHLWQPVAGWYFYMLSVFSTTSSRCIWDLLFYCWSDVLLLLWWGVVSWSLLFTQQSKTTESPRLKGDKELRPVSMRVRDAAEALLTAVLDYVVCTCHLWCR